MNPFLQIGFSELVALGALVVAAIEALTRGRKGTRSDAAQEQHLKDSLDTINNTLGQVLDSLKELNAKIDIHSTDIAAIREQVKTLFSRMDKVEQQIGERHD